MKRKEIVHCMSERVPGQVNRWYAWIVEYSSFHTEGDTREEAIAKAVEKLKRILRDNYQKGIVPGYKRREMQIEEMVVEFDDETLLDKKEKILAEMRALLSDPTMPVMEKVDELSALLTALEQVEEELKGEEK